MFVCANDKMAKEIKHTHTKEWYGNLFELIPILHSQAFSNPGLLCISVDSSRLVTKYLGQNPGA